MLCRAAPVHRATRSLRFGSAPPRELARAERLVDRGLLELEFAHWALAERNLHSVRRPHREVARSVVGAFRENTAVEIVSDRSAPCRRAGKGHRRRYDRCNAEW